jgi:hypothetical protein
MDLRLTQTESVLGILAISVCKNADQKEEYTQRSQRNGRPRIEFKNRTLAPLLDGNQKPVEATAA